MTKYIAMAIELIGITTGAIGLGLELAYKADIYFALITGGALIFAAGGVLYAKVGR